MSAFFIVSYVCLWILVVLMFVGMVALYRHFGHMYLGSPQGRETQGPAIGRELRIKNFRGLDGAQLGASGRRAVLVFTSFTCPLCVQLKADFPRLARLLDSDVDVFVVCAGREDQVRRWADDVPRAFHVVADRSFGITSKLSIGVTPFAVAADRNCVVRAKGVVNDSEGVLALVEATAPVAAPDGDGVVPALSS
jgi:hypothetical protein